MAVIIMHRRFDMSYHYFPKFSFSLKYIVHHKARQDPMAVSRLSKPKKHVFMDN